MKRCRKLLALGLALVMALAMSITVSAGTITVKNAVSGETYKAYKIFDVTNSGDNYAYTISGNSKWKDVVEKYAVTPEGETESQNVFTLTQSSSDTNIYVVTVNQHNGTPLFGENDAAEFAAYLASNIPVGLTDSDYCKVTAGENGATFQDLDAGYYFVTTSLGALCALNTSVGNVEIEEKNSAPGLEKKIVVNETEATSTTASIGNSITYKIIVTDGVGTNSAITVHDVMENGLTFNKNGSDLAKNDFNVTIVKKDADSETINDNEWSVKVGSESGDNVTACTFEIIFVKDLVSRLSAGDKIVITYTATLNKDAEISPQTNDNTAWLTYSNFKSTPSVVHVTTYSADLVKTGEEKSSGSNTYDVLSGAKFKLYNSQTGGNGIPLVKVTDATNGDYYRPALKGETEAAIEAGEATIKGLGSGTYYLEEIEAPDGYNKLTERKEFKINNANLTNTKAENKIYNRITEEKTDSGVQVINKSGSLLPSTGGIGTTIFYVAGAILVIGAGVLLITKKRMRNK